MENLNNGEIALLLLLLAELCLTAYLHGKPKDGNHNFFVTLVSVILAIMLYKWAGLF